MPASYPASIKSFTTKVDFTTTVIAEHVNTLQEEVVAVQSALGDNIATGSGWVGTVNFITSSWSTLKDRLANIEYGLKTVYDGTMLSGSISNSRLANSSITINGTSISLGGSATIGAATAQTLTFGTGLTGSPASSFNGSTATTISLTNSSVTINGTSVSLGGSATVTAAAGTLTGTTLNSTVVSSSLTSVGTLGSLGVTGAVTAGSFVGNGAALTGLKDSEVAVYALMGVWQ